METQNNKELTDLLITNSVGDKSKDRHFYIMTGDLGLEDFIKSGEELGIPVELLLQYIEKREWEEEGILYRGYLISK